MWAEDARRNNKGIYHLSQVQKENDEGLVWQEYFSWSCDIWTLLNFHAIITQRALMATKPLLLEAQQERSSCCIRSNGLNFKLARAGSALSRR